MRLQKELDTRPYKRGDTVALGFSRTALCQIMSDLAWLNEVVADFAAAVEQTPLEDDRRRGAEILLALNGEDAYVKQVPPARLQILAWALQQSSNLSDPALRAILTPAKHRFEDYLWEKDINPSHGAQIGEGGNVEDLYDQQATLWLDAAMQKRSMRRAAPNTSLTVVGNSRPAPLKRTTSLPSPR